MTAEAIDPNLWRYTGRGLADVSVALGASQTSRSERAEIAMALWESLAEAEREGELEFTPEEAAELDRRWMDHVHRPESAIPWDDVRRRLMEREIDDRREPGPLYSTKGCR